MDIISHPHALTSTAICYGISVWLTCTYPFTVRENMLGFWMGIMTSSKYNAHTYPLFKDLGILKVRDISDVQCLKLWYKFVNNELPHFFKSMSTYYHELYETQTHSHCMLHLYPMRTAGPRLNIKTVLSTYGDFHVKDKTAVRTSYL